MKVLITGGSGFIGSRLAIRCRQLGHEVTVLGRQDATDAELANCEKLRGHGVDIALGSVTDRERMFEIVAGASAVFHLAAAQHEMNIDDDVFRQVNVEGTRNMLDASIEAGVNRFIHGSTIGVYDRDVDEEVDEETPVKPDNIYGVTKAEGEKVVRSYFDRLPITIIRISETYGPGDRRLLKLFRAIDKGVFFMIGRGENLHQLIYVEDLIDGLLLALESDQGLSQTYVLAGKEQLTSNEMVKAVAGAVGGRLRSWHAPLWLFLLAATILESVFRPLGIQPPLHRRRMDFFTKSFRISTDKARKELGFEAKTMFAEGTRATAQWYRKSGML